MPLTNLCKQLNAIAMKNNAAQEICLVLLICHMIKLSKNEDLLN